MLKGISVVETIDGFLSPPDEVLGEAGKLDIR